MRKEADFAISERISFSILRCPMTGWLMPPMLT